MERKKAPIELVKDPPTEAHRSQTKSRKGMLDLQGVVDIPFLILVVLLVFIGVIMLFSASYARSYEETGNAAHYFTRQAFFAASGIGIMLAASCVNYQYWRTFGFGIMAAAFLFLLAVPVVGASEGGATRWINLGFVSFQPSEIAKLGMILTFAALMAQWKDRMHTFQYGVVPFAGIMAAVVFLLYLEPHLSASLIILAVGAIMMYLGGTDKKWLILGFCMAVLLVMVYLGTQDYSGGRFDAWLHPELDAQGKGYQVIQSRMAIGSGGLTGLGFGKSRQKYLYLPEEHNDYIFAVVCEELGFIGACLIILLFMLLIIRGYWLAMHAHDRFGALTIAGLISLLAIQVFLNIGVVSNLLPSTGISLPFFSYGGTALWVNLAEMGIILGVSRKNTNNLSFQDKKKPKKTGGKKYARDVHLRGDRRSH